MFKHVQSRKLGRSSRTGSDSIGLSIKGELLMEQQSRVGAQGSKAYSQFVLLFVYANLLSSLYTEIRGDGFVAFIGSYNLWSTDIVVVASLPMLLMALQNPSVGGYARWFALGWLAIVTLWLLRAIPISSHMTALSFRRYAALCVGLLAFGLRPVSQATFKKIRSAFISIGLCVAALVVLRLIFGATLFVPANSGGLWAYAVDGRPVQALAALILGEALIFSMSRHSTVSKSRFMGFDSNRAVTIVLAATLIVSGQRTAMAATAIGVAVLVIANSKVRLGGFVILIAIFGGLATLVALAAFNGGQLLLILPQILAGGHAVADFSFRTQIWNSIVQNFSTWSLPEQLFGKADTWTLFWYLVRDDAIHTDARSAHNELLGALLFTGIMGVAMLVCMMISTIVEAVRAIQQRNPLNVSGVPPALVLALIAIVVVYSVSYEWLYEQGIILGLCIAGWPRLRRARSHRATPRGAA
jgi:hypothetical protein